MKFLLTSAGISNTSIHNALVDLLEKPIAQANAVFIPTAIYALPNGGDIARRVINGSLGDPFCEMGWKSLAILELTALPTIKKEIWIDVLEKADAILVGGGDCQYLTYWMLQTGLADMLPSLLANKVYVGLSAGSMVTTRYGTSYNNHVLPASTPKSLDLFDFAIHPHLDHEGFANNTMARLKSVAATLPMPSYLIDDQTALKISNGNIEVISEGNWILCKP